MAIAAEIGMSENEFWQTTPRYFMHLQRAFTNRLEREENMFKWQMEAIRNNTFFLYNHQLDTNDRLPRNNILPLPWDVVEEKKEETLEDVKKWVEDHGLMKIPKEEWIHRKKQ